MEIDGEIGDHHVRDISARRDGENKSAIGVRDHAVVDGDVADSETVALAELDCGRSRRQHAISDGDVFAEARRAPGMF